MIDLRWLVSPRTNTAPPVLQFRNWVRDDFNQWSWTEWREVPVFVATEVLPKHPTLPDTPKEYDQKLPNRWEHSCPKHPKGAGIPLYSFHSPCRFCEKHRP